MADASLPAATVAAILRMAQREARAHLLTARNPLVDPVRPLIVRVLTCPECRAGAESIRRQRAPVPLPHAVFDDGSDPPAGSSVLTMLGCEALTARSLVATSPTPEDTQPRYFRTRAAAWAQSSRGPRGPVGAERSIAAVDAAEERCWPSGRAARGTGTATAVRGRPPQITLPTSCRLSFPDWRGMEHPVTSPRFLSPHGSGIARSYELLYREHLVAAVAQHLQ